MKRKKTFNIGEVSRLFNISVDSIRYYEKIGILEPTRNEGNNYRVYTLSDIRQLTMIRELLGLNFSTERIKEFDRNQNVETTKMLLSEELNIVNKNIVELFEKKVSIEGIINFKVVLVRKICNKNATEIPRVLTISTFHKYNSD